MLSSTNGNCKTRNCISKYDLIFTEFLGQTEGEVSATLLKQIILPNKKECLLGMIIMLIKIQDCKFMEFPFLPNLLFTHKFLEA